MEHVRSETPDLKDEEGEGNNVSEPNSSSESRKVYGSHAQLYGERIHRSLPGPLSAANQSRFIPAVVKQPGKCDCLD
jgi:hypothetical protein